MYTRDKKVAIIIPSMSHGGAERVVSIVSNTWVENDVEVHIINFSSLPRHYEIDSRVKYCNFEISRKPSIFELLALAYRVRTYVVKNKIDYALSFMDRYNIFTLITLFMTNVRVTITDRNSPNKRLSILLRLLKRMIYPWASGVIAQTELARSNLIDSSYATNVVVIPNPVCIPVLMSINSAERVNIILAVGRLVPEKGHEHLLRAFNNASIPEWRLVIVGDGPLRQSLETLIYDLGLHDKVTLTGMVGDVSVWYRRASIFALSSISEGFPNVILEAMAYGLPTVAFDCIAGPSDIITPGVEGVLVKEMDVEAFSNSLHLLSINKQLRKKMGDNAAQRALDFSHTEIAIKYFDFCVYGKLQT